MHHAFTAPKPEWEDRIESDTGSVLADAYDIVRNGRRGGGSRIHRRDIQERVFAVMGLDKAVRRRKSSDSVGGVYVWRTAARRIAFAGTDHRRWPGWDSEP